jgi:deazaflavin-dependent oxidoreductase (nitroreductase family)
VDAKRAANRSYLTPTGRTLAWITAIHRGLYTMTFGLLGHTIHQRAEKGTGFFLLRPMSVLLLTTTGRKTGLTRTVPLPYFEYDGRTFLVGSFSGGERHPAWFLNLRDQPAVRVQRGRKKLAARAVLLEGAERARYWERLTNDWPRYRVYQAGTSREIPLVEVVPEE